MVVVVVVVKRSRQKKGRDGGCFLVRLHISSFDSGSGGGRILVGFNKEVENWKMRFRPETRDCHQDGLNLSSVDMLKTIVLRLAFTQFPPWDVTTFLMVYEDSKVL